MKFNAKQTMESKKVALTAKQQKISRQGDFSLW